jgi:hypothetical protein
MWQRMRWERMQWQRWLALAERAGPKTKQRGAGDSASPFSSEVTGGWRLPQSGRRKGGGTSCVPTLSEGCLSLAFLPKILSSTLNLQLGTPEPPVLPLVPPGLSASPSTFGLILDRVTPSALPFLVNQRFQPRPYRKSHSSCIFRIPVLSCRREAPNVLRFRRSNVPKSLVIPIDRYASSTYLLCLPLLRKLPGCTPILPTKELP